MEASALEAKERKESEELREEVQNIKNEIVLLKESMNEMKKP